MRSAGIILGVLIGAVAGTVGCGPPPPEQESPSLRVPSRRVTIIQHDRRWPHEEPTTMAAVTSPPPRLGGGIDGGGSVPPATVPSATTQPAAVAAFGEHPPIQPAMPAVTTTPAATATQNAVPSGDPSVPAASPPAAPAPGTALSAVTPAAPATPAVPAAVPATQPIVIEARLSIGEAGVLQLAPATQPIPVQLQPLTIQLAAGSEPIRVHLDNPVDATATARTAPAPLPTAPPTVAVPSAVPRAGWGMTLLLLVWVLLAGAAGGAAAHLLVADVVSNTNGSAINGRGAAGAARQRFLTALVVGAAVAFVVPILLGLIAPDLLDRARLHQADLAGVIIASLLAGIASRPLTILLRRSVFAALHDARAEAESAKSRADAVRGDVARATALMGALVESQVDMDSDVGNGESDNRILQAAKNLDEEDAEVLAVLAKGADRFRSEPGLVARAELDLGTVQSALSRLEREGYAGRVSSPRTGERLWYLTRQGRKLAATRYIV